MRLRAVLLASVLALACRKRTPIRDDHTPQPPVARVVADKQDHPTGIFADATHVYWTNAGSGRRQGSIARAGKAPNSPVEVLVSELDAPHAIVVDNGRAYWSSTQKAAGGLGWVSLADKLQLGRPSRVAGSIDEPSSIAIDHGEIFFVDVHLRHVASAPLLGGIDATRVQVLANTDSRPVGIGVDANDVFWADSDPGVICRAPRAGGPITTLVARGDKTVALAIDDENLFFAETVSGRIGRVRKSGGGLAVLANDQAGVLAIALDRDRVYWTHAPSGTLRSMPKSGGAVITHVSGLAQPTALTVDDATIYWVERDAGLVRAIDKR